MSLQPSAISSAEAEKMRSIFLEPASSLLGAGILDGNCRIFDGPDQSQVTDVGRHMPAVSKPIPRAVIVLRRSGFRRT